jgi:hypothetical protein
MPVLALATPDEATTKRALSIVGGVYGLSLAAVQVRYWESNCGNDERPGFWGLLKPQNCNHASIIPLYPIVDVAWRAGMRLSTSGLCEGAYQYWEEVVDGFPDVNCERPRCRGSETARKVTACSAALKGAGL